MIIQINERMWNRIAICAGIFSFVISILVIANYLQMKRADPVNMKVINTLVERLNQSPKDEQLRDEIRTLDLLSRKAYFTSRWQIRTGGYLLLIGLAIALISLQFIELNRKKQPVIPGEMNEDVLLTQKNSRRWIAAGGITIVGVSLFLAFLSYQELEQKFVVAATPASVKQIRENKQPENNKTPLTNEADNQTVKKTELVEGDTKNGHPVVEEKTRKAIENSETESKDNFSEFRGPGGFGVASQKNIPVNWDGTKGENILWKTEVPLSGCSSPVSWGNKIFLTGASATRREVYCFDSKNGKILWTTAVEKQQETVTQVPKVSEETGYSAPTPVTDGKGVYSIFSNGDMIALDMLGKKMWMKNLGVPENHYGHASSLRLFKDRIIVQYDQKTSPKLMALSAKTGDIIWSTIRPVKVSWSSPIIANTGSRVEIITTADPYVASYNPETGEELWKLSCISGEVGPSPAYANGMLFTINDYSKLAAIKLGDQPKVLWETSDDLSDIPSPVADDKYLFVATSFGVADCYDAQAGTKYWTHEFNNSIYSSPMLVDGKVYLLDRTGLMHIFKADKEYVSISENKLGEKSVCTPAFTNGHIFLRGEKNLFCIGK